MSTHYKEVHILIKELDNILNNMDGDDALNVQSLEDSRFPDAPTDLCTSPSTPDFPPPPDLLFSDNFIPSQDADENEDATDANERIPDCVEESSSDEDDIDFSDADLAIDKMLDDLQIFSRELSNDNLECERGDFVMLLPKQDIPEPPVLDDTNVNFLKLKSIANVEDTPEVDLDALLEDLCATEKGISGSSRASLKREGQDMSFSENGDIITPETATLRDLSPSFPTRGMSFSGMITHDVRERLETLQTVLESNELSPEDQQEKIKAEKIKIALEKMKAASFQELFIKVYNNEQHTDKTIMIDQTWTARDVQNKMMAKDNVEPGPNWCILEKLTDLFMERILEDSEYVLQTVLDWGRGTENTLVFVDRRDKYMLFRNPQNFLLTTEDTKEDAQLAEKSKDVLLREFFTKDSTRIPKTPKSFLWLKEGRKKWVKHYFSLRVSGIYYTPKGKQKSSDMICLATFEHINIYKCVGFKKRFNAPTDHVFCIKHPKVQTFKSKHIYCLCAESAKMKEYWITVIRMAKYGYTMYEDYYKTQEELECVLLGICRDTSHKKESSNVGVGDGLTSNERKKATKKAGNDTLSRVEGKQNALGSIFSSAWSKGDEASKKYRVAEDETSIDLSDDEY